MKSLWGALAGTILVTIGVSVSARAEEPALAVKVPFDFYVGTKLLPAGEYVIESSRGLVLVREKKSGDAVATTATVPVKAPHEGINQRVVFQSRGKQHYLAQLWWLDCDYGQQVVNTR